MPFTDKRQQSSLRLASFHIQKAFIWNKCAFCIYLDEQTLWLSENSSQREEASMLKGSTLKSPKNWEAAETCGPVESPRTPTLRISGLSQICTGPSAPASVNNRLYNPNRAHKGSSYYMWTKSTQFYVYTHLKRQLNPLRDFLDTFPKATGGPIWPPTSGRPLGWPPTQ